MKLNIEIKESEQLIQWLDKKINGLGIGDDDRSRLAAGCLDIALEHHKSIILLSANKLFGSAFALVRLIFESYVRGVWLFYCATENDLNQFKDEKFDKKFYQLINDLEKHEAFNVGTLSQVKEISWSIMNSFTHSGFYHIVRRNKEQEISPNYTDEEILDAIETTNSLSILITIAIADIANNNGLAIEVYEKGMEYFNLKP